MRTLWAVVPMKSLERAKGRLAECLSPGERRALACVMLDDVLGALGRVRRLSGILVVTADVAVRARAQRFGAEVLDEAAEGLNPALEQATAHLEARGVEGCIVVPADVPLITPSELGLALARLPAAPAVFLAPDRRGLGTNLLGCAPAAAILPRFGAGSAVAHRAAARERGAAYVEHELPGVGHDVDTFGDLLDLSLCRGRTQTQLFVRERGLAERIGQLSMSPR